VHELSGQACVCLECQRPLRQMGFDVREILELVPARLVVHEHRLAKLGCGHCKNRVVTAKAPTRPIPGSPVGASVLSNTACAKILDHMPLYRLAQSYARDGWDVPSSTLSGHIALVAERVRPLYRRIQQRVLASHLLQTDASGLKVQDRDVVGNMRSGTMWCNVGDKKWVAFNYAKTGRGEDGPWKFLAGRTGYIQADAANSFDRLFNGRVASATEVGCWAHTRRRFFKLKDQDPRVARPLKLIAMLYRLERMATDQQLGHRGRQAMREAKSRVLLREFYKWIAQHAGREPPTSALGKAMAYATNHRGALERFVEDGRLPLDNNFCEGRIRGLALGRKNYLFAGSHDAAESLAVLYSVLHTAVLHGAEPYRYLAEVLTGLSGKITNTAIEQWMPDAWVASGSPDN
jgi:transposase